MITQIFQYKASLLYQGFAKEENTIIRSDRMNNGLNINKKRTSKICQKIAGGKDQCSNL